MPLIRRVPKRGFSNENFRTKYAIVNLSELEQFAPGATIDETFLRENNLVRGKVDGVKILGNGVLTKKFEVVASKVSLAAKDKIEKAGGSVTVK
jgi:large subunit ribosomal protein L15